MSLKFRQEMVKKTGEILERNPELVRVLQSPVYRREKKHAIIEEIWKTPEFSSVMIKFLKKACDAGAIAEFSQIMDICERCERVADGVMECRTLVCDGCRMRLQTGRHSAVSVQKTYGKREVQLSLASHPELMGGFVLKAGDVEYDYSLLGQIKAIEPGCGGIGVW